jgi:hypothetical protein
MEAFYGWYNVIPDISMARHPMHWQAFPIAAIEGLENDPVFWRKFHTSP